MPTGNVSENEKLFTPLDDGGPMLTQATDEFVQDVAAVTGEDEKFTRSMAHGKISEKDVEAGEKEHSTATPQGGAGKHTPAWQRAAAHLGKLRRTTMTEYFAPIGQIKSLTGIHTRTPLHPPTTPSKRSQTPFDERLPTPSPRRTRAAGRMRDELSWIRSIVAQALQDVPGHQGQAARNSSLLPRFVRPLPSLAPKYTVRLATELWLIAELGFEDCFLQVLKVLELAKVFVCLCVCVYVFVCLCQLPRHDWPTILIRMIRILY
jgi:hypothetical protein